MAQTVMQKLLKFAEYRREKSADIHKSAWNMMISEIKENSIHVEHERIIKDFEAGYKIGVSGIPFTGEQYYSKVYKNDAT